MKRLVVGDIHGCYSELEALLDEVGLSSDDEIIAIGDIVNRGPDSPRVLDFFCRTPNARSLKGNHEHKHVLSFHGRSSPALSQIIAREQFGEDAYPKAVAYMESLPHFLEFADAIIVHGFFEPGVPLREQRDDVLLGTLDGEAYLRARYGWPWYELYDGEKPLIVGHRHYLGTARPLIHRDRIFAIDTGCTHRGALTGMLLPGFRIVSVPSARNYWPETRDAFIELRAASIPPESLSWRETNRLLSRNEKEVPAAVRDLIARLRPLRDAAERALSELRRSLLVGNDRPQAQKLAPLLDPARTGELTLDDVRRVFEGPGDLVGFVNDLGHPIS